MGCTGVQASQSLATYCVCGSDYAIQSVVKAILRKWPAVTERLISGWQIGVRT